MTMRSRSAAPTPEAAAGEDLVALARRRLRGRNVALLYVLGGMALLFYLLTFVILGGRGS